MRLRGLVATMGVALPTEVNSDDDTSKHHANDVEVSRDLAVQGSARPVHASWPGRSRARDSSVS